jgi:hypothetical protein
MTGHKTRSVFERYNIVITCDLVEAAKKLNVLQPGNSVRRTRASTLRRPSRRREALRSEGRLSVPA